jgi:hypothetical protein
MYFPSYEVITMGPNAGRYFQADHRSVTEEGVAHVMRLFLKHLGGGQTVSEKMANPAVHAPGLEKLTQDVSEVFCDEQMLDAGYWTKAL